VTAAPAARGSSERTGAITPPVSDCGAPRVIDTIGRSAGSWTLLLAAANTPRALASV
jgi:hypothetical protein